MNAKPTLRGVELLRQAVYLASLEGEDFNGRWSADQFLRLTRMHALCGWDFVPAQWTVRQVREALLGIVPQWDENERPVYGRKGTYLHERT